MITASQAAAKIRRAIKKVGYNPNGRVKVRNDYYETSITIDMPYNEEAENAVIEAMAKIDYQNGYCGNNFTYHW